jgi:TPR repeat protein
MGTPVNASAAFEQFSLAAADGYGEAYSNLGYLHLEGLGTPRNLTAAFEAYKLS